MAKVLNICYGCGIILDASDNECVNCGAEEFDGGPGWIKAKLSDEDGERLAKSTNIMMDEAPNSAE